MLYSASAVSIAMAMKIVVSSFYFASLVLLLVLLCSLILSLATTERALCFVAYLTVPLVTSTLLIRNLIHLTSMTSSVFPGFVVWLLASSLSV